VPEPVHRRTRAPVNLPEPLPPEFVEPLARAAARLGLFARQILWYPDVSSTNDLAATLAESGAPEGCVVSANAQSAGRGRQGRSWASPAGAGLYVSTILKPAQHALSLLTIAAGVAVADGIHAATGLVPDLKWPNDVFISGRKAAGVLAEAASSGAGTYVVLGFGINVLPAAYPPEVAPRATNLEREVGRAVDRGLLLAECLCSLAARYQDLESGRIESVVNAWRSHAAATLGRRVRWHAAGGVLEGAADTIDENGALVVRTSTGLARITAGEVQWV